jgi:hypothetical protein
MIYIRITTAYLTFIMYFFFHLVCMIDHISSMLCSAYVQLHLPLHCVGLHCIIIKYTCCSTFHYITFTALQCIIQELVHIISSYCLKLEYRLNIISILTIKYYHVIHLVANVLQKAIRTHSLSYHNIVSYHEICSKQCTRGVTFLLGPGVGMLEHPGHASRSLRDGASITWLSQVPLDATWRAPIGPHLVPGQVAVEGSHRRSQPILLCITWFLLLLFLADVPALLTILWYYCFLFYCFDSCYSIGARRMIPGQNIFLVSVETAQAIPSFCASPETCYHLPNPLK